MAATTGINPWRGREMVPLSPSEIEGFDAGRAPEESLTAHSEGEEEPIEEAGPERESLPPALKELFFLDGEQIKKRIHAMPAGEREQAVEAVACFSLLGRFRREHADEVARVYKINSDEYFEEQLRVARFNRAIRVEPSDPLSVKMEIWAQAKNRVESTIAVGDGGKLIYVDSPYGLTRVGDYCMFTPIRGRYDWVVKNYVPKFPPDLVEMNPKFRDQNGDEVQLDDGVSYALLYPNPDNPEELWQLTVKTGENALPHTNDAFWYHTRARYIPALMRHLDELYVELREIGERMGREPPREFYDQLAHVYWLAANICRTPRGNAQYCLNFLAHEMKRWGLPPLIPRVGVLPDCVALSVPLEIFQGSFLNLFEPQETAKRFLR